MESEYLIMPSLHVENISIHNQTVIQYSECIMQILEVALMVL